jgi:hypothetical protein
MDLYLPDDFRALSEASNPRRERPFERDDAWYGGEAFVAPMRDACETRIRARDEPDPIWQVI